MAKRFIYCCRMIGTPVNRRYLVQRSDCKFLGGGGRWVADQPKALVYRTLADAQGACRPFIDRQTRGKPRRQFVCTLTVNVIGKDARPVTSEDVIQYLLKVMVTGIDYEQFHDGPVADYHVEVRARLGELREVTGDGAVRK